MIENRTTDIFAEKDLDVIAHQANCYCTFGSGIAAVIRQKYPSAYEADLDTDKGDMKKLGTYSHAIIEEGDRKFIIANVYGQGGFFNRRQGNRDTNYDALCDGLTLLKDDLLANSNRQVVIGVPWKIGCALGGGSWTIVSAILEDIFGDEDKIKCVICKLPDAE